MKMSRHLVVAIASAWLMAIFAVQGAAALPDSAWMPPTGDWLQERGWRLGTFRSETADAEVG